MDSKHTVNKPHAVCIPLPGQSHMMAMLKLAKLLHSKGFHVTFVNTELNHARILKSSGGTANLLSSLPGLHFETIPDGLPFDFERNEQTVGESIRKNFHRLFRDLVDKINGRCSSADTPPVSCIVADGFMTFSIAVAQELGIPIALFFTVSASCFMAGKHYKALKDKGIVPLKDESYLTNGYLDTIVDWIPGMKNIRLKDLPTDLPTTDSDNLVFDIMLEACENAHKASAVVFHTFDVLEQNILHVLSTMLPCIYTIGPLQLLLRHVTENPVELGGVNLWKEETECLQWLDSKPLSSVVYVNFGSMVVLTQQQLIEFGMGLADSNHNFLWVIRCDLVAGNSAILPPEFMARTKERGMISSWCPQEQVLNHASVGGFLTHCGWNSTLESVSAGVPMLCWPFQVDQQLNCKYCCDEWGVGVEIDRDVTRGAVEKLVKELMEGDRGKMMKQKVVEWKNLAEEASGPGGSSSLNLDKLVNVLLKG